MATARRWGLKSTGERVCWCVWGGMYVMFSCRCDCALHLLPPPAPRHTRHTRAPPCCRRAQLRKLRLVGDRLFERAAEAAARPRVLRLAGDFVDLARKAANSWPDIKPWLNASDIAALVAKVVGSTLPTLPTPHAAHVAHAARAAHAVRAAHATCAPCLPPPPRLPPSPLAPPQAPTSCLPACWPAEPLAAPRCCRPGAPARSRAHPCRPLTPAFPPCLPCPALPCPALPCLPAGGQLQLLAERQAGGAGQAGTARGPRLQGGGGHRLAGAPAAGGLPRMPGPAVPGRAGWMAGWAEVRRQGATIALAPGTLHAPAVPAAQAFSPRSPPAAGLQPAEQPEAAAAAPAAAAAKGGGQWHRRQCHRWWRRGQRHRGQRH